MDKNIGVGLIVGLTIATTLFAVTYDKFNRGQKIVLFLFIVFPPLQWISIISLLVYNHFKYKTSKEGKEERKATNEINKNETQFRNLKELRDNGVLTKEEYDQKIKNIENSKRETELKLSEDYKKLKSLFDDGILTKEEFEGKVKILTEKKENEKIRNKEKSIIKVSLSTKQGTLEIHTESKMGYYNIGDLAFLDNKPATDGRYVFGWPAWWNYIEIKDGKIINMSLSLS